MNLLFFPHLFGFGFIFYFLASIAESAPIVAPEATDRKLAAIKIHVD